MLTAASVALPRAGRILNQLVGGYAVGVGGLVCFLPAQACHAITASRIGKLQVRATLGWVHAARRAMCLLRGQMVAIPLGWQRAP